jgi:hypothetical protein
MARTDDQWEPGLDNTYIQTTNPTGYNVLINGINKYLNFNSISGSSGYGFRDNAGTIEFKNSGGTWTALGSGIGGSITSGQVAFGDTTANTIKGTANATVDASGNLTAASFIKSGGTSSQFLKADGSVDSSTYLTSVSLTLPTGSVDGINQVFVFATAPNAIAVDGQLLQKVDQSGNIYWTGTTTVTLTFAPNQSVFGIA